MEPKAITESEVKTHNKPKDLWFIIHDNVYDVTKFKDDHPGGEEVLLEHAGRDASDAFDDIGHSENAKTLMEKYFIGPVQKTVKKLAEVSPEQPLENKVKTVPSSVTTTAPVTSAGSTTTPNEESKQDNGDSHSSLRPEGYFATTDGHKLFYQGWLPLLLDKLRAINIYIHGGVASSYHASTLAEALLPVNIGTYAFDLRGFGHWPGISGELYDRNNYIEDVHTFVTFVKNRHPGLPLILSGHSMGGLVGLAFLAKYQHYFACSIISAPWLKNKVSINGILLMLANFITYVHPNFSQPLAFKLEELTHDQAVIEEHMREIEQFNKKSLTVRWYTECSTLQQEVINAADKITLPIIYFFGGKDLLSDIEVGKAVYDKLLSKDKEWVFYPEFFHEVFHEIGREVPLNKAKDFVLKYI